MAYEFKKINTVDTVSTIDNNINLVVEQTGTVKRMNIADIPQRAQADWNETNESSPAYILNKPDLSSVGGGNASITYFIMSYGANLGDPPIVKVGDTWATATPLTKSAVVDAFNNGIVRMKYAANANSVVTLLSYKYPASGFGTVYYIDSAGTIASFQAGA